MLSRALLPLLALGLVLTSARAAEKKAPATGPVLTSASMAEKKAAAAAAARDSDLTTYYVCLLTKGSFAGVGVTEERVKTQAAQNAYINELAAKGKLLVAGPFVDNSEWKGIYIFKCDNLAEAQSLALGDPEIRASRLKFEIHPWTTAKGSIRDPAFPTGN